MGTSVGLTLICGTKGDREWVCGVLSEGEPIIVYYYYYKKDNDSVITTYNEMAVIVYRQSISVKQHINK